MIRLPMLRAVRDEVANIDYDENTVRGVYDVMDAGYFFMNIPPTKIKSERVSAEHRVRGNLHFKYGELDKARSIYTQAIATAPLGSRQLALAYGNRSAVSFHLKLYNSTILDINKAIPLITTDDSIYKKLVDRKKACFGMVEDTVRTSPLEEIDSLCTTLSPVNPEIPCSIKSVEFAYNLEHGRHAIAKEDIEAGRIIALEKPYIYVIAKKCMYILCRECLEPMDSPIPCDLCIYAVYCSVECKEKSDNGVHKYECPLMDTLLTLNRVERFTFSFLIKAWIEHGSWQALRIKINEWESATPFEKGFVQKEDGSKMFSSDHFETAYSLERKEKITEMDIKIKFAIYAVNMMSVLEGTELLKDSPQEDKWFAAKLLMKCFRTTKMHTHGYDFTIDSKDKYQYGLGLFSFASLFAHSCNQNVIRLNFGTSLMLLAWKPIEKGERIYDSYGPHFCAMEYEARKSILSAYDFTCECEACSKKWPKFEELFDNDYIIPALGISIENMNETNYDIETTITTLKTIYHNIDILYTFEPSKIVTYHFYCLQLHLWIYRKIARAILENK